MRVEEVATRESLAALAPEWQMLCKRTANASPFQTPEWLMPWYGHLFRGGELLMLALRQNGRLIGLAPLFIYGVNFKCLSFLGSGVSDYLDILLEPEEDMAAVEMAVDYLRAHGERWQRCELADLRSDSPLLSCAMPREWNIERTISSRCPVLSLPETLTELESRISSKFRRNLEHAKNKLVRAGELQFETANEDRDEEFLETLFRLHAEEWARKKDGGIFATEALRTFYRQVLRGFRRSGYSRLYGLRFQGELKAVLWCFVLGQRAYYYISGFDAALAQFSPGMLLLEYAIRCAIGEGLREFDFLRGSESYKYRWGAADRLNFRLRIESRS